MSHGGTIRELRCPPALKDAPPSRIGWWRNKGKILGILAAPGSEEVISYIEPGGSFVAARVMAMPGGRRYIQLLAGGWVPECSRKDPTKIVAVPVADHANANANAKEVTTTGTVSPPSATSSTSTEGESGQKRRRLSTEATQVDKELPESGCPVVRVQQLRFTILATKAFASCMQIAEIALRCKGKVLSLTGFKATSPNSYSPLAEGPEKLMQAPGKFLDSNFSSHGQTVIIVEAPGLFEVEEFALRTANDMPARDPGRVVVDGSIDGKDWTLLMDSGPGVPVPDMRRTWTPWFVLKEQGEAKKQAAVSTAGAKRFICTVPNCRSYQASAEGYLVEGKLLNHMLRHHRRSAKTAELTRKFEEAGKLKSKSGKKIASQDLLKSPESNGAETTPEPKEGEHKNQEGSALGGKIDAKSKGPAASAEGPPSSSSSSSSDEEDEEEDNDTVQRPKAAGSSAAGPHPETPQRKGRVAESSEAADMRQTPPPVDQRKGGSAANFLAEVSAALSSLPSAEVLEVATQIPCRPACPGAVEPVSIADLKDLRRYPPFEGTVSGRRKVHDDGSFAVTLLDPSGAVEVTFVGAAAEAFKDEQCLRAGSCLRLQGYDLLPTQTKSNDQRCFEILVASANAAVTVAPPDNEADFSPTQALMRLDAINKAGLHTIVNVEAVVQEVRPIFTVSRVETRTLVLRQGEAVALLMLRREKAKGHGAELLGRHIIVRGTQVLEFRGQRLLSGWRRMEFASYS